MNAVFNLSAGKLRFCAVLSSAICFLLACSNSDENPSRVPSPLSTALVSNEPSPQPPIIEHEPAVLETPFECDASILLDFTSGMSSAVALAEDRYTDLLARTATSSREYIDYTNTQGQWVLQSPSRWTSGFLAGSLWYLYALTGADRWRVEAENSNSGLRHLALATDNDTGFQIYGSYGIGRNVLSGLWPEADLAIEEAAATLITQRFNPDVGAYRAWPQSESDPFEFSAQSPFELNVDMIMNMELVLSAAEQNNSSELLSSAISHADVTWLNLIRPDFSSYHVAGFDSDGSLSYTRTHQGWRDDSTWSRGQSWAVYGYTMMYRYTQLPRMLERAEKTYQYFKQASFDENLNWVPLADFDAEDSIRNPRDSSAAAIVASAGLELYELTGNTLYLSDALAILDELISFYLSSGANFESILIAGSEQYVREDDDFVADTDGYEVGASFGDFYFLEALYRFKNIPVPICS